MSGNAIEVPVSTTKVTAQELRENVDADKTLSIEVIDKAKEQITSFLNIELTPDITGQPNGVQQFNQYKRDQVRNLDHIKRSPFFSRISAQMTIQGQTEDMNILLTTARELGGVFVEDGWMLASWTSPLALNIRGKKPGDRVEIKVRTSPVIYKVDETAQYEELLPRVVGAKFHLKDGMAVLENEDELDSMAAASKPSTEIKAKEYQAKTTFGLSDIIVLVDEPQRAALALPFDQSVTIEGPPGSGKTSVGIMRIAVLSDQQWDFLKLDRKVAKPFHSYTTMRVLVYNEEMVEYLKGLAQSIGVEHVEISTTKQFFLRACRAVKLLTGTHRKDKQSLASLKGRREMLKAYFAGFKAHAISYWVRHETELRQKLFALGPDFLVLSDWLNGWIERIRSTVLDGDRIVGSIRIADPLTEVVETIRHGGSATSKATTWEKSVPAPSAVTTNRLPVDQIPPLLAEAKKLVETVVRGACSRVGATRAMFDLPEYADAKQAVLADGVPERTVEDGDRLWRRQYAGDLPAYSELDLAMSTWLGAPLLLSNHPTRTPWIGGKLEQLTHIVVDEAQDLSPSHLIVLATQLAPKGTMTLVGDIHQNLNPHTGLRRWQDAGLPEMKMSAFSVNHRQTQQLGEFMRALHLELFGEESMWTASSKTTGPLPRAGVARSWSQLARAIATEARHWCDRFSGSGNARVAVLYDGIIQPMRLKWLRKKLEVALSDLLLTVELISPSGGGEQLRRPDQVSIAPVRQSKGLEFDAVIVVESKSRWSKPVDQIDLRYRNGFYVATSRAQAGLSLCMSNLPSCIQDLVNRGLCDSVAWPEENEQISH